MTRVKRAGRLMPKQFTQMDTPTASHATNTHQEGKLLDYYDQRCVTESYCQDTLFAFGSEDYQQQPVNDTRFMLMGPLSDSITMIETET